MAWVYILRGSSGRHYIGSTDNLDRRIAEHRRGSNHTTRRFGATIELLAARELSSMAEARKLETALKRQKIETSQCSRCSQLVDLVEQPRKLSGLVPGSSPGRPKLLFLL